MILNNYRGYTREWTLDTLFQNKEQYEQFVSACIEGRTNIDVKSNKTDILLFAQPKSASLYFHHLLSLVFEFRQFEVGFNQGGGSLYYPRILAAKFTAGGTVSHCHELGDNFTYEVIKNLNLKPIILSRNLLDALVSRRDMLIKNLKEGYLLSHKLNTEASNIFLEKDNEYQLDVIIELFAREYMSFYMSWKNAQIEQSLDLIFTTYEEITQKPVDLLQKIAHWIGKETLSENHISDCIKKIATNGGVNFNKGKKGRGADAFSTVQIEHLRRLASLLSCDDSDFLGFEI